MAQVCEQCGKHPRVGCSVSHSNRKTLRRFNPNLMKKKVLDVKTGEVASMKICARCLRSSTKVA